MATPTPDVETIIAAANAIFKTVPGIKRVYSECPNVPPSGDLPCVIPILEKINQDSQAFSYQRKDYKITYLLLVAPGGARDLPSLEKQARPFGDPVLDAFYPHVKLNSDQIDHASLDDGEYTAITLNKAGSALQGQSSYVGWMFTLNATLKKSLEIGN
jgi:hypothetical protein